MNRPFTINSVSVIDVPDGTKVYPFLNAKDLTQDLEWDLLDGFSVVAGDIGPGISSKIHVHPVVTQVTLVIQGEITIRMKDPAEEKPYQLKLKPEQAVLTRPKTFFQLVNETRKNVRVIYIVSPDYLYEVDDNKKTIYDDAISLDLTWPQLAKTRWQIPQFTDLKSWQEKRAACYQRLRARKQQIRSGRK